MPRDREHPVVIGREHRLLALRSQELDGCQVQRIGGAHGNREWLQRTRENGRSKPGSYFVNSSPPRTGLMISLPASTSPYSITRTARADTAT